MSPVQQGVPELVALARTVGGPPERALDQLLRLLCEQTGLQEALVASVAGGVRTVRAGVVAGSPGTPPWVGGSGPVEESLCATVLARGHLLLPDAAAQPGLDRLPAASAVGAFVGAPLRDPDGIAVGTVCSWSAGAAPTLNARDEQVVQGLAEVLAPWLAALDAGSTSAPAPAAPDPAAPDPADPLERLARPLLDALHEVTGLASVYLTQRLDGGVRQSIRFTRNTADAVGGFTIPEGVVLPWEDALCKRALDDGTPVVTDVQHAWADHPTAAGLGVATYATVPVLLTDGTLWGTLCAADPVSRPATAQHLPTLTVFAGLIGAEVERSAADREREALVARAREEAETDFLTGCSNRRVVLPWLARALRSLAPEEAVVVCFLDVDAFKSVNDGHDHATGDAVLVELGRALRGASRPGDLVARLGGDEFVTAAVVPAEAHEAVTRRTREAADLTVEVPGGTLPVRATVGVALGRAGEDASSVLVRADQDMYRRKNLLDAR